MYLWETIAGERMYDICDWVPYIYEYDEQGTEKTIDGVPVSRKEFGSYKQYDEYQKANRMTIYENEVPREIQFLAERYHEIPDDEIEVPELKIYSIDIEVHSEKGFPKPQDADWPIVLINVRHFGGKNWSWGIKPYTGDNPEGMVYHHCKDEVSLMHSFFLWWRQNAPDVVTGWNICPNNKMNKRGGFDFPYIINRCKKVFGTKSDVYKNLSPIGIVRCWDDNKTGTFNVDIAGVSVIDYFALYKWYTQENPENHKLDTIARHELKLGKLDYSQYTNLKTLFHENWDTYVDYNVIDNKLIEQLEDKLGYIRLAQNLTLLCKTKMETYTAATHLIEGLMMANYRRNGYCAPRLVGGSQEWFPAAYVKEPQVGQYDWVSDLDIASSYPTAIITLNMSPETYFGRLIAYENEHGRWVEMLGADRNDEDIGGIIKMETPITEMVKARTFPKFKLLKPTGVKVVSGDDLAMFNRAVKRGLLAIAPCGSMYRTDKIGHMAQVEYDVFNNRSYIKTLMKATRKEAQLEEGDEKKRLDVKAENFFAQQWALKIILNSMYGVAGVPYSRYFNLHTSEAIASCGRRAIVEGEKFVNRWFQTGLWKDDAKITEIMEHIGNYDKTVNIEEDFVAYIDTDSVFIRIGDFIKATTGDSFDRFGHEEQVDIVLRISKLIEEYVNDCAYDETQIGCYNSPVKRERFAITFKQEIVCKSALFVSKKKYGYHLVNEEGDPKDKIDVTGMEIIRSETPASFKEGLSTLLEMILRKADDDTILENYTEYKGRALAAYPEEISENKGIKDINKWMRGGDYIKGTPYHVKAAVNYHKVLADLDLSDKYPSIEEETKNKLVYVKTNPYRIQTIMYEDRWPVEFTQAGIEPDYNKMIEKFFTGKLKMLLNAAGRLYILEQNKSFNLFF